MINYTPNLNLAKPTLSDVADITVISNNFDILDSALAKMVTTDSPQTISGSKTFTGTVIVNGHNLRNAVTMDEAQTITGSKTFEVIPNIKSSILNREVITTFIQNSGWLPSLVDVNGRKMNEIWSQYTSDGNNYIYLASVRTNGTQINLPIAVFNRNTGTVFSLGATPTDSAPSNALVTKANVMSTDGKLNNLVHTIGEEQIYGDKYFHNKIARKIDDLNINNIPTSNVYPNLLDFRDNQGNSVGYLGAIETAGQSYRLLNLRAKGTDGTIRSFSLQLRFDRTTNLEVLQMAWSDGTYSTIASRTVQ